MSIMYPLVIISAVAFIFAVWGAVTANNASNPSLRVTAVVLLALLGTAAGLLAWWVWRFSEEFTW